MASRTKTNQGQNLHTGRVDVLESRQLSGTHLVNNALNASRRHDVGLYNGDVLLGFDMLEELVGRCLVSHNSKDVAFGTQGSKDGGDTNVAS